MTDPAMIRHQAYLCDLEKLAQATRKQTYRLKDGPPNRPGRHGRLLVEAFFAMIAFVPWRAMPVWGQRSGR